MRVRAPVSFRMPEIRAARADGRGRRGDRADGSDARQRRVGVGRDGADGAVDMQHARADRGGPGVGIGGRQVEHARPVLRQSGRAGDHPAHVQSRRCVIDGHHPRIRAESDRKTQRRAARALRRIDRGHQVHRVAVDRVTAVLDRQRVEARVGRDVVGVRQGRPRHAGREDQVIPRDRGHAAHPVRRVRPVHVGRRPCAGPRRCRKNQPRLQRLQPQSQCSPIPLRAPPSPSR